MRTFQFFVLDTLPTRVSYKTKILNIFFIILLISPSNLFAYTDISSEDVYAKLVSGDTLILLDVREVIEYQNVHIAEPAGQLPLTPANMPWNSNILQSEYNRLPGNVDIVVYCQSGGRSALASAFLETNGYTQIYNMLGGISSWVYDVRDGGYGDHSGQWVRVNDPFPIEIICTGSGDTSKIIFPPIALPVSDSIYIELHFASNTLFVPPNVPQSDMDGLFRVTAIDPFGLSLFEADSLALSDTSEIILVPDFHSNIIFNPVLKVFVPGEEWHIVESNFVIPAFSRNETVLRKWYNGEGWFTTGVAASNVENYKFEIQAYPNPFNSSTKIWFSVPHASKVAIKIFDILGRELETLFDEEKQSGIYKITFNAKSLTSGVYFYQLQAVGPKSNSGRVFVETKKMILLR